MTHWTIFHTIDLYGIQAIYFDKNTYRLQLVPRDYIFPAVLCEHGKSLIILLCTPMWTLTSHTQVLTDIKRYTYRPY